MAAHSLAMFCLSLMWELNFLTLSQIGLLGNPVDVRLLSFALMKYFLSTNKKEELKGCIS